MIGIPLVQFLVIGFPGETRELVMETVDLVKKIKDIKEKLKNNKPTIPSTLEDELKNNIFLRSSNDKIKTNLNIDNSSSLATFSKLRDLKDNF